MGEPRALTGTTAILGVALLGWCLFSGCAPASGQPRGFGSRQVLMTREPLLTLRAFSDDLSQIYLARVLPGQAHLSGILPYNRSLLTIATGADTPVQEAVLSAEFLPGDAGRARALVLVHFASAVEALDASDVFTASGPRPILSLVDEVTGERLQIPDIASFPRLGATRGHPMAVSRFNATGGLTSTWLGLPESLRPVGRLAVVGVDGAGAFTYINPLGQDGEQSVAHVPTDGSPATEVVPFRLRQHVVLPSDAADPLDPGTTAVPAEATLVGPQGMVYHCAPASDGVAMPRCFLLISRLRPPDAVSYFVRLVDDPIEIALPGVQPRTPASFAWPVPLRRSGGRTLLWLGMAGDAGRLFSWQVGADRAGSCPTADLKLRQLAWGSDEERFAVMTWTPQMMPEMTESEEGATYSWSVHTGRPGEPCRRIASGTVLTSESAPSVEQMVFSPDGSLLARLLPSVEGTPTITVSAPDGSGEHIVASGSILAGISFVEGNRLQLLRRSPDGLGLSWVDPTITSAPEHPIAERVANLGSAAWLNARWLLVGHSYSMQDDSFTLSAIDAETGNRRDISTAVTDFRIPWITPPPNVSAVPVAYMVRGRISSAQDGIWVANLPLAQFPDHQ